ARGGAEAYPATGGAHAAHAVDRRGELHESGERGDRYGARALIPLAHDASRRVWRFTCDLWRSACRPHVLRRCLGVALGVGTLLSLLNQGDAIAAGRFDAVVLLRIVGNYLIPFIVSNLGAMTTAPARPDERPPRSSA